LIPTVLQNGFPENRSSSSIVDVINSRITVPGSMPWLKVGIYSRPGIGKTFFGASGPKPIIFDVDQTTVSLDTDARYRETPVLHYKSAIGSETVFNEFKKGNFPQFQTFTLDSFSVFAARSITDLIRLQLGITDDSSQMESMLTRYMNTDIDYITHTQYMADILNKLDQLESHVIITCHLKEVIDANKNVHLRPDLSPRVYAAFSRWCNVLGYLDIDRGQRTLRIRPTYLIDAKTHLGNKGPDIIKDPTFESLLAIQRLNKE
jgi:hypothetical protein